MNEDFLHYIWKFQQFIHFGLQTAGNEPIQVLKTGRHNQNAGPDFLDARIRIGDTIWAGNVEIHINSSDWHKHNHSIDKAYDNVILHVVYTNDATVTTSSGEPIPVLCIKDLFDYQTFRQYKLWLKTASFIPCENNVKEVPELIKTSALELAAIDRLETKSQFCLDHLNETRGDIEDTFYRVLLRSFGLKVNALPFEHLARITPISLVRKVWNNASELEALFLGQAGFLSDLISDEPHIRELKKNYSFQVAKYGLQSMPLSGWKLFRLRPQNFPQVRLAQLARFYARWGAVSQIVTEAKTTTEVLKLFDIVLEDQFWMRHYTLEKSSRPVTKSIGHATSELMLINAVVPFLFALSAYNKDETYQERAMAFLEDIEPESNTVVKKFQDLLFPAKSALDTQGMIHQKQFMCDPRKCLNCKVGIHILKAYAKTH